jgi:phosphoglucosamine mutase
MVEMGQKATALRKFMEKYPQVTKNIRVKEKVPVEKLPAFQKLLAKYEHEFGANGRVVFRYSGTESLARIMVEGQDKDQVDTAAAELADELVQSIEIAKHQS